MFGGEVPFRVRLATKTEIMTKIKTKMKRKSHFLQLRRRIFQGKYKDRDNDKNENKYEAKV